MLFGSRRRQPNQASKVEKQEVRVGYLIREREPAALRAKKKQKFSSISGFIPTPKRRELIPFSTTVTFFHEF